MAFFHCNLPLPATSQVSKCFHKEQLEGVRQILSKTSKHRPLEGLRMVDNLHHLSIDHYFQQEIQSTIDTYYGGLIDGNGSIINKYGSNSLINASLCFRLLRQNGYYVNAGIFTRFLDKDGKFGKQLCKDIGGMMALYQASQFAIDGEELLDEANAFTTQTLHDYLPHMNQAEASFVTNALENPYHKTLARFNVKYYIESPEIKKQTFGPQLQKFAKMDFSIVQSKHQKEVGQVSLWWKNLGLSQRLSFARDQPEKWYMWSMAILADPMLSKERIQLTKPISLIYLMDDIFDIYGTLDELMLLTDALNKWEVNAIGHLPYNMKIFLQVLFNVTEEISYEIHKEHGWNPINSIKMAWKRLCNAFLKEARWFASEHLPGSEEYLENGMISSGVHVVFVHIFFLLGQNINQETINLLDDVPGIVYHTAAILRLWDDLGTAKDENQQGYDGSYIECYKKEHSGTTNESARQHVVYMISNIWKKLNKEYLSPTPFSLSFKKASFNFTRMVRLMYSYDANQRLPDLEKHIKTLLYEDIHLPEN